MGAFTNDAKNSMLDSLTVDACSLHSADPGATGANEISGGSYTRQAPTFNAASTGARALNADLTFSVPAGSTVSFVGYWSGTTFIGSDQVASESFSADGQYKVLASGTSLSIT